MDLLKSLKSVGIFLSERKGAENISLRLFIFIVIQGHPASSLYTGLCQVKSV